MSGVSRSWRFQPAARSAAIRAPTRARRHRPERGQADHEVERRRDPVPPKSCASSVRRRDQQVEDEREAEREDEEAPVAKGAQQLVAHVRGRVHRIASSSPLPVSSRKASSRPAPRDLDVARLGVGGEQRPDRGVGVGAARGSTASPRRSAPLTPGSRPAPPRSAPGSVARICAQPTVALISVVGAVGDDAAARHQHGAVGVGVGLLEVVGREQDRLAARRRTARIVGPERAARPRRPSRPSARRAPAGRGR